MRTIRKFLAASASRAPTPGGGSAAALTGALGCALGLKVSRLLMGRSSLKKKRKWLSGKARELQALLLKLTALIDRDQKAYEGLLRAQKTLHRIPQAKKEARAAPLQIRASSRRAHQLVGTLLPIAGSYLGSDLKAAQGLLSGAISAAHQMVLINR